MLITNNRPHLRLGVNANRSTPLLLQKKSTSSTYKVTFMSNILLHFFFTLDEHELNVQGDHPHIIEEDNIANIPDTESDDNLTLTDDEERPPNTEEEQIASDEVHTQPDISVEEDGGHFNKNKDNQPGFSESDEMQKVPQATLENPLDMGLGIEVDNSPPGV